MSASVHEARVQKSACLLGGSWVVISGAIRPLIWVITIVTLPITPLMTTHEPPSSMASCGDSRMAQVRLETALQHSVQF